MAPRRALGPGGAPEPSGGPLGMAGRVRGFGRRAAAGHSTCGPGCAGAAAACEGGASPEACEHHAGDAGGARLRGELLEAPPGSDSAPSGR
eukprot:10861133-Alexandrium_andersonii.AAC.1